MTIDPRLHRIVAAQPYPLLFATISGAHLYGFPSPGSDYDLRGAHVLPLDAVAGLEANRSSKFEIRGPKFVALDAHHAYHGETRGAESLPLQNERKELHGQSLHGFFTAHWGYEPSKREFSTEPWRTQRKPASVSSQPLCFVVRFMERQDALSCRFVAC